MRVIFLQDVPNVARTGDIKEVASGYARNYLIPYKMALLATPETVNALAEKLKAQARIQAQTEAELVEIANQLEGKEFSLEAQIGGKDRLYGSITSADIAAEIEKATGLVVDRRKIEMDESIRKTGSYDISIRLAKEIVPKIKITVSGKSSEEEA